MFVPVSSTTLLEFTVAVRLSNTRFPPIILKLSAPPEMVSNPSSVGLNGGEVSVGGQQSDLSSLAAVAVNTEPATIFFIVGPVRLI